MTNYTDLIAELRRPADPHWYRVRHEAVDAIETLQAENALLEAECETRQRYANVTDTECDRLRAENSGLRLGMKEYEEHLDLLRKRVANAEAENAAQQVETIELQAWMSELLNKEQT